MELPAGIDYAWLACDAENCVARFTNVGEGPIPAVVLGARNLADCAETLSWSRSSDAGLLCECPFFFGGRVVGIRRARCDVRVQMGLSARSAFWAGSGSRGLCLSREKPRLFYLDRCQNVRLAPAADFLTPVAMAG
jgi:hypothetical protein